MRRLLPLLLVLFAGHAAADGVVVVGRDDCARLLARHVPAADVAYRPGVDVEGRAVAPADLAPPIEMPDSFAIPITVDLRRRLGLRFGAELQVGTVLYRDGAAYFNGQRLTRDDEAGIAASCREALTRARAEP